MKRLLPSLLLCCCALPCYADAVQGSVMLSKGASYILASPLLSAQGKPVAASQVLAEGMVLTVAGISNVALAPVEILLKSTVHGSQFAVNVSRETLHQVGLSVGTTVNVSADLTGHLLVASGKVLAYIPNELGQTLLHQSKMQ